MDGTKLQSTQRGNFKYLARDILSKIESVKSEERQREKKEVLYRRSIPP